MTLEQLRIFIEVAKRQHLTHAAQALNLTPSAVSSAIRVLEQTHSVMLFNRIGRRIEITQAGEMFLIEAEATVARAKAAELTLSELGGLKRGRLSVHASQTISSYWLPPLLAQFHAFHPTIQLDLTIGNSEQVARATREGIADMGFIEGELDEPALIVEPIAQDRLIVVVASSHPWAGKSQLDLSDLAASYWILREKGSGTRSVFEHNLRAMDFDPSTLPLALQLPSNEAILSALQTGTYATAISALAAEPHLAGGRLVQVPFLLPPRRFLLLSHRERYRSHAFNAFYRLLS